MPLANTILGRYRIERRLRAGGMGEVYEATDTQLQRRVAIKILQRSLTREDAARFEREALTLSQLSHPNVCTVHDFGEAEGKQYLVMELIEGEPLDHRLAAGKLPLHEAVAISIQIARALAAAHARGIVHRDLKPANVMLTKTGVKLIDFGLARHCDPNDAETQLTTEGYIVGTPGFMSPEQLQGKHVDTRTDLFAFGAVLYQLLTGTPAFAASGADVLTRTPPIDPVPEPYRPLVTSCLANDPDERLQSAKDAELLLRSVTQQPQAPLARSGHSSATWLMPLLLCAAIALLGVSWWKAQHARPSYQNMRVQVTPPKGWFFDPYSAAISPDGTKIAFAASPKEGLSKLGLRTLNAGAAHIFDNTEEAMYPFWSPDSHHIGFFGKGKVRVLDVATGDVTIIANAPYGRGGAWNSDNIIVFAPTLAGPLMKVSASGGQPQPVTHV
ncbi:MAG: protein kinase, partial [Acidobacteriales bacterium]|nr:protein kinase [Terriglobales bacterium]